jgi:hypothetical protein
MTAMESAGTLAHLEGVIERGLQTFIEVGEALLRIREERLYREAGYSSFEAYCQQRWGHRRAWADRHITAVRKVAELDPTGSTPASEWQARQLLHPSGNPYRDLALKANTFIERQPGEGEDHSDRRRGKGAGLASPPVRRRHRLRSACDLGGVHPRPLRARTDLGPPMTAAGRVRWRCGGSGRPPRESGRPR